MREKPLRTKNPLEAGFGIHPDFVGNFKSVAAGCNADDLYY